MSEILTDLQRKVLRQFSGLPDQEAFYLTGGTALSAIYLKHRRSHDLDFFTPFEELIQPISLKLETSLLKGGVQVERLRAFHSFVELSVSLGSDFTIVHFALDSPFRFEEPSKVDEIFGVNVDSLIDIATNKLLALFGRAELRDFIDIYFLANEHFNKTELIEKASQKDPGFDLYWFGVAIERINDFADDSTDLLLLVRQCSMSELKEFFGQWKKEISSKVIGED